MKVGPATYFVGPSAELSAGFHVMNNIAMAGQSRGPSAGPTGSAWVTSQEASPGRGDKCPESPTGGQCYTGPPLGGNIEERISQEARTIDPRRQEPHFGFCPTGQQELPSPSVGEEEGWVLLVIMTEAGMSGPVLIRYPFYFSSKPVHWVPK